MFQSQGTGTQEGLLGGDKVPNPQLEALKDKLFISTGQDLLDIWEAFAFYGLEDRLSSDDIKNYA